MSEKTSRDYNLRSLEREIEHLKGELQQCERQKESFIRENRRLQDDLACAAKDCLSARRELEIEKDDVEKLKKQLQQYVAEVKKAEELLSKKVSTMFSYNILHACNVCSPLIIFIVTIIQIV